MKKTIAILLIFSKVCIAQMPGSGNTIVFDGTTAKITVPHSSSLTIGTNFTLEAWVKIAALPTGLNENIIIAKGLNANGYRLSIYDNDGTKMIYFTGRLNTAPYTQFYSSYTISSASLNKWIHIAGTKDAASAKLYVDGVLRSTNASSITIPDDGNPLTIGNYGSNIFNGFNGSIDEIKIWNIALTESQIRERMCVKIQATDPLYSNLKSYYNFNQSAGATIADQTANTNNGTVSNNCTWATSGAPIGDFGGYSYNVADNYYVSIANPLRGDKYNATLTSPISTANGIHIYGVNNYPNTLNGTQGVGTNRAYYGTFIANNNGAATYDAGFSFQALEPMLPTNLADLRIYKRTDNAATTWVDAGAVFSGTSCTAFGQNTEYIMGSIGTVLPLQITQFTATAKPNCNLLQWIIENNANTKEFEIERSTNAINFITIGKKIITINKSLYTHNDTYTSLLGEREAMYYRLKIMENDGKFSYSKIIQVHNITKLPTKLTPNIVHTIALLQIFDATLLHTNVKIVTEYGQVVKTFTINQYATTIDVTRLTSGMYFFKLNNGEIVRMIKE
ncbi:MAG: LamG-like jellyroll fold domain-containing protein [Ferruginibacter sp.]|nr:T9SS type A sorting domain-containing protein [Ferruginibacter sp.]